VIRDGVKDRHTHVPTSKGESGFLVHEPVWKMYSLRERECLSHSLWWMELSVI